MVRLRRAVAYRKIERPNTRWSKFKKFSYVRSRPVCKVVKGDMGQPGAKFEYKLELKSKAPVQIRDNALESARQTTLKLLEKNLGKIGWHLKMRVYPHHILRENPLASGAGADRMSTGMKHSFGKTIGIAAQVKDGQTIMALRINKVNLDLGKRALKRAGHKFACKTRLEVNPIEVAKLKVAAKVVSKKAAKPAAE